MAKTRKQTQVSPLSNTLPTPVNKFEKKIDLGLALKLRIKDGLSHEQIAERFGCTAGAVRLAFSRFACLTEDPAQLDAYRANKLGAFEAVEQALLERLFKEAVSGRASVGDLARAVDTVSKHIRLLQGASTQNIGLLVQTLASVHKDVDAALLPQVMVVEEEPTSPSAP